MSDTSSISKPWKKSKYGIKRDFWISVSSAMSDGTKGSWIEVDEKDASSRSSITDDPFDWSAIRPSPSKTSSSDIPGSSKSTISYSSSISNSCKKPNNIKWIVFVFVLFAIFAIHVFTKKRAPSNNLLQEVPTTKLSSFISSTITDLSEIKNHLGKHNEQSSFEISSSAHNAFTLSLICPRSAETMRDLGNSLNEVADHVSELSIGGNLAIRQCLRIIDSIIDWTDGSDTCGSGLSYLVNSISHLIPALLHGQNLQLLPNALTSNAWNFTHLLLRTQVDSQKNFLDRAFTEIDLVLNKMELLVHKVRTSSIMANVLWKNAREETESARHDFNEQLRSLKSSPWYVVTTLLKIEPPVDFEFVARDVAALSRVIDGLNLMAPDIVALVHDVKLLRSEIQGFRSDLKTVNIRYGCQLRSHIELIREKLKQFRREDSHE